MWLILFVNPVNFFTSVDSGQIPIQYMSSASDEFLCEPGFRMMEINVQHFQNKPSAKTFFLLVSYYVFYLQFDRLRTC